MSNKKKYKVIVGYLSNYVVKFCFFNAPIKEDEGGGWYSVIGHNLVCNASILRNNNSVEDAIYNPEELPNDYLKLFNEEKLRYENGVIHKQRLQSFNQLLINKNLKIKYL